MDTFSQTDSGLRQTTLPTKPAASLSSLVTEDKRSAVRQTADWFEDDKNGKSDILAEWAEIEKLRRSDHWSLLGANGDQLRSADEQRLHPNTVDNVTFSLVEGQVAEFSQDMELVDVPVEEGDDNAATLMTNVKKAIAEKNGLEVERLDWNRNFFWLGSAVWEHNWDPNWRGGRGPNRWAGEVRWRSLDPYHFYVDARCRKDLHEGTRCHKASYVTLEYLRDRYPEYGSFVQSEIMDSTNTSDEDESDSVAAEASQRDTVLLIETWYIGEPLCLDPGEASYGKGLHVIWWAGEGQRVYLKHANYVYWEPGEEPRFPFTFRWRYPRRNSVWGYGEAYYLEHQNISLNKHAEIILEGNMAGAHGRIYFEPGVGMDDKQQKFAEENGSLPGIHIAVNDVNRIKTVYGQPVSPAIQNECDRIRRGMEGQIGRFDVSQGRTPGSVTAFAAIDALAKNARIRLISAEVAQRTAYQDCGRYLNQLVVGNYTEARAYRIVGKSLDAPPTRGTFRLADVQKVHFPATGTVIPFKGWTPPPGSVEGEDYEIYTPELDVYCRLSTPMPSDRLVFMELAKELYMGKAIGPQTLLYVIDKGKFPPIEQLMQELAAMQPQAPVPQVAPPPTPPGAPPAGSALPPELRDQLSQLPPDEQEAVLERLLQTTQGNPPG